MKAKSIKEFNIIKTKINVTLDKILTSSDESNVLDLILKLTNHLEDIEKLKREDYEKDRELDDIIERYNQLQREKRLKKEKRKVILSSRLEKLAVPIRPAIPRRLYSSIGMTRM